METHKTSENMSVVLLFYQYLQHESYNYSIRVVLEVCHRPFLSSSLSAITIFVNFWSCWVQQKPKNFHTFGLVSLFFSSAHYFYQTQVPIHIGPIELGPNLGSPFF